MLSPHDIAQFSISKLLSDRGRDVLAAHTRLQQAPPQTLLVRRGDDIADVFMVASGEIRVYYIHPQGREGTLYWVEAGESCFTSMNCAFSEKPYPAWAETGDKHTSYAVVPSQVFLSLYQSEPALQMYTFDLLSRRVFELMHVVEATGTQAIDQRVAALLLRLSEEAEGHRIEISQERLANHVGTAREVVARTLRAFRRKGYLSTSRGCITLEDTNSLRDVATTT